MKHMLRSLTLVTIGVLAFLGPEGLLRVAILALCLGGAWLVLKESENDRPS